ncbi:MAG: DUF6165 family protein [Thiohalocapsa sp.]
MPLLVPVSVGELFDKISILELKRQAIADPGQRDNVERELALLEDVRRREIPAIAGLQPLFAELGEVNRRLWDTEDRLRACEREGQFDAQFVALARSVYRDNDRRSAIKRRINELTGSDIIEEKSYL